MTSLASLAPFWPEIAAGFGLTLETWLVGTLGGLALGFLLAILCHFSGSPARLPVGIYVTIMRGVPFLVVLFVVYYGGPSLGLLLDPLPAGLVGLSLYAGAYFTEIFRGSFAAVSPGQIEAARIAGIGSARCFLHVTMPQALRLAVPALSNMVVILTKETSVLSVITINELTSVMSTIGRQTFDFTPTLFVLAATYWVLLEAAAYVGRRVEGRLGRYVQARPR